MRRYFCLVQISCDVCTRFARYLYAKKQSCMINASITPLIKTITKFSILIGYQQPDLRINWTVAHVMLVIGQYASSWARRGAIC